MSKVSIAEISASLANNKWDIIRGLVPLPPTRNPDK